MKVRFLGHPVQTFIQKSDPTRNAKYQIHKYTLIWIFNPIYGKTIVACV